MTPYPATEKTFQARDGAELFYRAWLPDEPVDRYVLLFHRGHEHSGRFQEMARFLNLPDAAIFAWDSRGCGLSQGERGDARSIGQLASDMDDFLRHLQDEHGVVPGRTAVVAHSVAAVVAGVWMLDYAPKIRCLVLAAPALEVKLYVPFARPALRLMNAFGKMRKVRSYVRGAALTHDTVQAEIYDSDPLICKDISTRLLLDLDRAAARLLENAGNICVPALVLAARADWVVKNRPIRRLFRKLGGHKQSKVYRGFSHSLFHELGRSQVFADVSAFIQRNFESRENASLDTLSAASRERYEWHAAGPPPLSLANWCWGATRLALRSVGRLSQGLNLGLKSGFSSGQTLDYVYRNSPAGLGPVGRMIDQGFLASSGWVCIRQRRRHLVQLLTAAVEATGKGHVHVMDIAGGPGRYLLELLESSRQAGLRITVRDLDEEALAVGRGLAAEQGEGRIEYVSGDAFDVEQLRALGTVDVAVVSGLYELFPDNVPVVASLHGLSRAVRPGGFLIYTNQPSHPQLELIAETLTHADGRRWVMRCRSTAEMDTLVENAGFTKLQTLVDDHGIFSVSLAQRLS